MTRTKFTVSISRRQIFSKEQAEQDIGSIWRSMQTESVTLKELKDTIENKYPFLCCKRKKEWNGQQLFCIDIDQFIPPAEMNFKTFIEVLDALGLPPCIAYTTFHNPDRKKERFRLLFQLDEPVNTLEEAKAVLKIFYNTINELAPGSPDYKCLQPYHLFYPGKKIILYRPKMSARRDYLNEIIQETKKPYLVIDTVKVWNKIKQILDKDPFIPSIKFYERPPGLLIILGSSKTPKVMNYQVLLNTVSGKFSISLRNNNGLCYTLIYLVSPKTIIDNIYSISRAAECSNKNLRTQCLSVFEHYEAMLSVMIARFAIYKNCTSEQAKEYLQKGKEIVNKCLGIQIVKNQPMILPTRLGYYAHAVSDLSAYPNLAKLFQRDLRKQQALASVILCARDIHIAGQANAPFPCEHQCIITHTAIAEKMKKRFKTSISSDALTEWLKLFHDLDLIHLCTEEEIATPLKKNRCTGRRPTVIQVPYFDRSVLIHAEIKAKRYQPSVKKIPDNDMNYMTCLNILIALLNTHHCFSRDSFVQCIRQENELGNTDGFTVENAMTYFDKYIPEIQEKLGLTKAPCTKQLIARFPGNHKIGSTRLYFRNEET